MHRESFADSLKRGPHRLLARLHGRWTGTARTWFEPGKLADTQPIKAAIRPILEGRFALLTYTSKLVGTKMLGHAKIGHDLSRGKFVMSWADSAHNGTNIMSLLQDRETLPREFSLRGSYADPSGGPDWGWRIVFKLSSPRRLFITHYNILPTGQEAMAVEMVLSRVQG